jgi:hypothetical protein
MLGKMTHGSLQDFNSGYYKLYQVAFPADMSKNVIREEVTANEDNCIIRNFIIGTNL